MSYCLDKAIPHSIFLGRVPLPGEPRWLPEDRAKAMAALLEKNERCQRCGTADWEWEEDEFAYDVVPKYCHGCYVLARGEEGERGETATPGRTMELVPKAVAAKLRHHPPKRFARRRRRRRE